jgi:predicted ATPase
MQDLFVRGIRVDEGQDEKSYPFTIPAVRDVGDILFSAPVTFLVGENGSGKSTIVETVAVAAGFNAEGGTKNYSFSTENTTSKLADTTTLIRGTKREKYGYFLRAESFYTTANYTERGTFGPAGPIPILFEGKHIHEQSHGEAFLSIVKSFRPGLFIFDEPESALSPQRILHLMSAMHELVKQGSQFIIATHSPVLLAYPGATIYQLSDTGVDQVKYEDIEHVKMTRDFLNNPSVFISKLFLDK